MKNSQVEDFNVTSTARGHLRMNHTFTVLQYSFQTPRNQITKFGSHKHSQQQIEPSQKQFFLKHIWRSTFHLFTTDGSIFKQVLLDVFSIRSQQSMKPHMYVWFTVDKYSAAGQNSLWNHMSMSDSLSTSIQQTVTTVSQTTCVCLIHCRQVFRDVYSFNTIMYGVELSSRSTVL